MLSEYIVYNVWVDVVKKSCDSYGLPRLVALSSNRTDNCFVLTGNFGKLISIVVGRLIVNHNTHSVNMPLQFAQSRQ